MPRLRVMKAGTIDSGSDTSNATRNLPVRTDVRYASTHGTSSAYAVPQLLVYG